MDDFDKFIREKIDCCVCGKSMKDSEHINIVGLDKIAMWDYPVSGNVLSGERMNRAAGIICDNCIGNRADTKYAVELRDGEVIYHDVDLLEDAPPLFLRPDVNCYGNLICPHCKEEILGTFDVLTVPDIIICNFCGAGFELTKEFARLANEISRNYGILSGMSKAKV